MVLGRVSGTGKGISGCVSSVSDPSYFCMEWNAENQLTRVLLNSNEVARFSYGPLGRRVEKVASGITTSYTYDGEDMLREVRGATTLKYVHGPGIDARLAQEDGAGAFTYYHADGLGSIVRMTDSAGVVGHEYRYDAWGNIEAGAGAPSYSFTGREWDPEIALYYYRARYYDPAVGRFLSEDPAGPNGASFYPYVLNNPQSLLDPSGLKALSAYEVLKLVRLHNHSGPSDALIVCIAYRESTFDPDAKNPKPGSTASGLMGVTRGAATDEGTDFAQIFDPVVNIETGSRYLARRIRWAHGNVRAGVGNYGEGAHYADAVLKCEACLLKVLATKDPFDSGRNPQCCLNKAKE